MAGAHRRWAPVAVLARGIAATNPGCWRHGYDAARCCHLAAGQAHDCWSPGEHELRRRECCELGGYILDPLLAAALPRAPPAFQDEEHVGLQCGALWRFFLPSDYAINERPADFVDSDFAGQAPVYGLALAAARGMGAQHVVEVGGGGGEWAKLLLQQGFSLTLLDRRGPNLRNATAKLRESAGAEGGRWEALAWDIDLEPPPVLHARSPTIAVAADVIEHLLRPRALLQLVRDVLARRAAWAVVLSTPDRDAFYDRRFHRGPPQNPAHVREWSSAEFARLLRCEGLPVGGLFEVEGTLVALLGAAPAAAAALAASVWASPDAAAMSIRWRHLG